MRLVSCTDRLLCPDAARANVSDHGKPCENHYMHVPRTASCAWYRKAPTPREFALKVCCKALLRLTPIAGVWFEYIRLPLLSVFSDSVWKAMKTTAPSSSKK